jgi:phospholipid/cholesterol/gamma-HCH transport system permease protein
MSALADRFFDAGPRRVFVWIEHTAGASTMTARAVRSLATPGLPWWRDFVAQAWECIRRCAIPVWLSIFFFHFGAVGIVGGELFHVLGADERIAYFPPVGVIRETGPFVAAIVIAGVVGTAICADLASRKVREELDAMRVLGIDPVRKLVAPRLLALTLITPLVSISAADLNTLATLLTASLRFDVDAHAFFSSFAGNLNWIELVASLLKCSLFGLLIGVVFCYAGLSARGGTEGVGRAVNQAVVFCVVAIFIVNFAFNSTLLGLFPQLQDLR